MGEIHEFFVLALTLVWFAGATPEIQRILTDGLYTVAAVRWFKFGPDSKIPYPTPLLPQFDLNLTLVLPMFSLFSPRFNPCSAGNLKPRFRNHHLQTLGLSETKFRTEFPFVSLEKLPEFRRKRDLYEPLLAAMAQVLPQ